MAQHDRDTAAESHDAPETAAGEVWTTTSVERPAETERSEGQAISAPAAPTKQRRKNWHRFTLLAATLGLLATAGSIAAYRFRDKHEKLAAFATVVDETFARPEKLVTALRDNVVKWTGMAEKSAEPAKAPAPIDLGKADTSPAPAAVPMETKPPEPAAPPRSSGDRTTWAAPSSTPAPAPAPAPVAPAVAPAPAAAPEPPAEPVAETKPTAAPADERTEALTRRVDELERIAREALALAEQARSRAAAAAGEAPRPNPKLQDIEDNVGGLEGRIDWLSDRLDELREKLEAPKGETRVAREAVEPPPPPPPPPPPAAAEPARGPDPTNILVVANSLQRALDRGAPYASEHAALAAQGADPEALAALAPSAEKGAPDARALRVSFHSLARKLEDSAELRPDAPLADRLLHGASKLVKVRTAAEKEKASIGDIAAKVEAALDRGEIEAALATFAELPDDAKTVAREWEETARRRLAAETAAASILSGALDALVKSKN